jgi:multidrug efflux system membrane fusion protein
MNEINKSMNGNQNSQSPGLLRRWWLWLLVIVLVGAGAYFYLKPANVEAQQSGGAQGDASHRGKGGAGGAGGGRNAVPVVVTAAAKSGDIDVYLNGLGSVTPVATVTVKTHLAGELMKVLYTEGQMVQKGQLLAVVDPRPYQVALEQAEGTLAHDQALLQNARVDLKRYQTLFKQDSIQEQQLATQDALVRQYEAQIKTDQGAVDAQKLNITYCNITAPVSGRTGLRLVDPGNLVQPSDATGLVVITQLQPITVVFAIPEDNIPSVMQKIQAGVKLPVDTFDRANNQKLASGHLLTLDNQVNVSTGTVNLKAEFANDNFGLFPSQFVNSRLLVETKHDQIIIPSAGVQRGSQGTYVYIINDDHSVTLRLVKVGVTEGDNSSIVDGLKAGENVVVDGADKLRDGLKVEVASKDANKPAASDSGDGSTHQHRHKKDGDSSASASASASATASAPAAASATPAAASVSASTDAAAAAATDASAQGNGHHKHHRDDSDSGDTAGKAASN